MKHDAIVKQGTNRDKIVYSQLSNIKEKRGDVEKLQAPTADEAALTAERTRQAFEKVSLLWVPPILSLSLFGTRTRTPSPTRGSLCVTRALPMRN